MSGITPKTNFFILAQLACLLTCHTITFSNELDWPRLEKLLEMTEGGLDKSGAWLELPELATVNVRTNTRLFLEMAVQREYPFVAVAGLIGLQRLSPDLCYRVALGRAWTSTNIGSPVLFPFVEYIALSTNVTQDVFDSAFSTVAVLPANSDAALIIIEQLPVDRLFGWLRSTKPALSPLFVEAIVIERLLAQERHLNSADAQFLWSRLERLRDVPGYPIAIYLLHAEKPLTDLVSAFHGVLADRSVDVAIKMLLFKKHSKRVIGRLTLDDLPIDEKTRKRYEQWMIKLSKE